MVTPTPTRLTILVLAIFSLVAGVPTGQVRAWPLAEWEQWNQAAAPRFPGRTWQGYATPEEAGWSSDGLAAAEKLSRAYGSAAVMVIHDGAVLAKWGRIEHRYMCHSLRKSLLSALYGIAVAKGDIDLEETIGSIGIEDSVALSETERSAKVSDLLKSRSGVYLPAAYETEGMKKARPERGSHAPGTHWYYNNWDFNTLGTIYNEKTADDLFEAFKRDIADPLEMQDFQLRHTYYHLEPENSRHPAYPFRMSARDLARFGLLYLNEGRWGDRQIIPRQWVRESTRSYSETSLGGYGYMWWRVHHQLDALGAYAAAGYGGQWIIVVPGARLVFVHRMDTYDDKTIDFIPVWTILFTILNARVGPPVADPTLVALESVPVENRPTLSAAQLAALTGRYAGDGFEVRVRATADGLEAESASFGRYLLLPNSPTRFIIEDYEEPLEFLLDERGKAAAIRLGSIDDDPLELVRKE